MGLKILYTVELYISMDDFAVHAFLPLAILKNLCQISFHLLIDERTLLYNKAVSPRSQKVK